MDKNIPKGLHSFKQSALTWGLLVPSLGLGLTSCSDASLNRNGQNNSFRHNSPANHAATYFPERQIKAPYVLMAQNNSVPKLRGMSQVQRGIFQQYNYDDYSRPHTAPNTVPVVSSARSPRAMPRGNVKPVRASDVRQQLRHQLEEAAPRKIKSYKPAAPKSTRSKPITYAAQQAKVYQGVRPQNYNAQTVTSQQPSSGVQSVKPSSPATVTSLTQSLTTAVKQSPRLVIEEIKVQEAEEQLEQVRAQGRFKLNLEGLVGAGQNETTFRVIDRTDSDFRVRRSANLNLSLPLYQGGRINAAKDVAKVDIKTAKANYKAVQNAVSEQAGIAHLNVLRDRDLVEVYKRNVALLQSQKTTVQSLLRAGESTVTDEALVDARLASIQVRLKQAQSDLSASESRYKKLTGYVAPSLLPVQKVNLPHSLQDAKEAALSNNAQLHARQFQSEAANHNIKVAKSLGRPKLALQGSLRTSEGQSDTIRRSSAAELLLNLSVPLISGGENKSRVRKAALEQSRAALETRALQDDLNERLEQLWATIRAAKESQGPNLTQKLAAEKAYEAILLQRKAGLVTSLDVLSIEQTLLDAELNIIQAKNTEGVARLQVLGLMGAL